MRFFDLWKSRQKTVGLKNEEPLNFDETTQYILVALHGNHCKNAMENLLKQLDSMHNILPDIANESPEQRLDRKDSLIAIALNQIHEELVVLDPQKGSKTLRDQEDLGALCDAIGYELNQMNGVEPGKTQHRWAMLAREAAKQHQSSMTPSH